jgi:hypothetical protein
MEQQGAGANEGMAAVKPLGSATNPDDKKLVVLWKQ